MPFFCIRRSTRSIPAGKPLALLFDHPRAAVGPLNFCMDHLDKKEHLTICQTHAMRLVAFTPSTIACNTDIQYGEVKSKICCKLLCVGKLTFATNPSWLQRCFSLWFQLGLVPILGIPPCWNIAVLANARSVLLRVREWALMPMHHSEISEWPANDAGSLDLSALAYWSCATFGGVFLVKPWPPSHLQNLLQDKLQLWGRS